MKDNLILKKFKTENVNGTFNLLEEETIFGSKVMDIEDNIFINDEGIKYYQYYYNIIDPNDLSGQTLAKNNGYQFFDVDVYNETFNILDLVELKYNNHTIIQSQQTDVDKKNNTKWIIDINARKILREYLFAKIKERRTFRSLRYTNFLNNDINKSIYDYIDMNINDRYAFNYIEFFVKYTDIKNNTIYSNTTLKQFDPTFANYIESVENKNTSVNVEVSNLIDPLSNIKINYFQTKPSTNYKFDYYFNIYFKKI